MLNTGLNSMSMIISTTTGHKIMLVMNKDWHFINSRIVRAMQSVTLHRKKQMLKYPQLISYTTAVKLK